MRDVNILTLVKDTERYLFMFDGKSSETLLQTFGEYAADDDLSFTWYDAAVLSQRVRQLQHHLEDDASVTSAPKTPR